MQDTRRMFGGSIPNSSLNAAIILNGINNFEDKMNNAYDQGIILFKMLNDSEKYKIYFNDNHSNVFQMQVDTEDNYNKIRSNLGVINFGFDKITQTSSSERIFC